MVSKAEISKELTVTPADTTSHMIQYVMPGDANPAGITFGGQVRGWPPSLWMQRCCVDRNP